MTSKRAPWVLLTYRLPRERPTRRSSLWRKLRRLGAAQHLDGLAALPPDARNCEQLEWPADEVIEAGGEATLWVRQLSSAAQKRELRKIRARDYFPPPEREQAQRAVEELAWLIRRFIDQPAEFVFVDDADEVPADATPFDMRGVKLGHQGGDCSFETFLRRYELPDPVLWKLAKIVHEADLVDERFDAAEAPGLDVLLRGLSMTHDDE